MPRIGLTAEEIKDKSIDIAKELVKILQSTTLAFLHPKLVAQYIHEKREPLLRIVVESVLKGLNLK